MNRYLAFGHGAHHCLGGLFAKVEMKYLYQEILERVASVELYRGPK